MAKIRTAPCHTCGPRPLKLILIAATALLAPHLTGAFVTNSGPARSRLLNNNALKNRESRLYQSYRSNGTDITSTSSTFWTPSEERSSRLKVRRRFRSALQRVRGRTSRLLSSSNDNNNNPADTTWSQSVEKSSTLGVRNRVKEVLKKAKSRTGVENASEDDAAGLWIAEAASIGGLPEEENTDLLTKPKNGVAKANGKAYANGKSYANGASSPKTLMPPSVMGYDIKRNGAKANGTSKPKSYSNSSDLDGLRADVPTPPPEPLPFKLPRLTTEQKKMLMSGERVQEQSKMGREGSGYVVVDVKAPPYVIWESLLDFENYPDLIKTVRSMKMFTSNKLKSGYHAEKPVPAEATKSLRHYGIPSVTRAAFVLSKFKLNIAAIHNYRPHPDGHYMVFNLDPECTNVVLKKAQGIWYTQQNPDGRGEEYTRVWLLCELKVSTLLPTFIVDYAAKRAMPRATTWLKPHVEPLAEQWALEQEQIRKADSSR